MSVENTNQHTRISAKDLWKTQGETDWERVRAISDDDLEAAIADDPDAVGTDVATLEDAVACPPLTFLDDNQ
jgi:hypothetical protein